MLITIALLRLNQGHKHHNLMEIINLYKLIHDNLEMEIGYKNEKWWKYMSTWQLKIPWKCPFGDYVYDADQSYLKIYHCAPAMFCCMNGLQRKNKIMLKISKNKRGYPNISIIPFYSDTVCWQWPLIWWLPLIRQRSFISFFNIEISSVGMPLWFQRIMILIWFI